MENGKRLTLILFFLATLPADHRPHPTARYGQFVVVETPPDLGDRGAARGKLLMLA
jgi:hypothetical protein